MIYFIGNSNWDFKKQALTTYVNNENTELYIGMRK